MHKQKGHILAIDRNEDVLFALKVVLKAHFEIFKTESNPANIEALLNAETFDVILLDINLCSDLTSEPASFSYLKKIIHIAPTTVVLLITPYSDIQKSMLALADGANDFILKPWQNEKVLATVLSALELSRLRYEIRYLKEKQQGLYRVIDKPFSDLISESKAMQKVVNTIHNLAPTDDNVLIVGEKGTGKELIARALHKKSLRKHEAFISINLNIISPDEVENELFGDVKDTFAPAKTHKIGRIELAHKGTLFIEDMDKLPSPLQVKLLSIIQNNTLSYLDSTKAKYFDVRWICTSNMPLTNIAKKNEPATNLINQFNFVEVVLPPLRQRMEDIPLLAEYFLNNFSRKYKKVAKLSKGALNKLLRYGWPGNVQELRLVLQNAVIFSENQILGEDLFQLTTPNSTENSFEINTCNLEDLERYMIEKVLHQNQGNISKAAVKLGLTRTSLYRRMEKYGL